MTVKLGKNTYPTKVRTPVVKFNIASHVDSKKNKNSQKNYRKIIKHRCRNFEQNLKIECKTNRSKKKKNDFYCLIPIHNSQRKTMCKLFYGNFLVGKNWKRIVTFEEDWICSSDCNRKRSIYYRKLDKKSLTCWFRQNKNALLKVL